MKDIYTWIATMRDGSQTNEQEAQSFTNIDQAQVDAIELHPAWGDDLHRVDIPDGAQPVFFRRRTVVVNAQSPQGGIDNTIHCIGWKRGNEAVYLFIKDDGSTLLTNDLQAV